MPAVLPAGRSESLFFSWKQNHGTNLAADPSLSAEENLFNVWTLHVTLMMFSIPASACIKSASSF